MNVATPLNINKKPQLDDGSGKIDERIFQSMIGNLIYLAHTRPNLAFVVSLVSCYMNAPTMTQMGVMKHILNYISGLFSWELSIIISTVWSSWFCQ